MILMNKIILCILLRWFIQIQNGSKRTSGQIINDRE